MEEKKNKELKETISEFADELEERIQELKQMSGQELFHISDKQKGRVIELHSKNFDVQQLGSLALDCWEKFFPSNNGSNICVK